MLLKLALRNVFRNRARSLITLSAIGVGCAAFIVAGGFIEDSNTQARESYIRGFLGHIQINKKGYLDNGIARPFDFMISNPDKVIETVTKVKHVKIASPRLEFYGLLSSGETTISFMAQGVDTKMDSEITANQVDIVSGDRLRSDSLEIMLGIGLADAVGVKVGDPVILLANTKGGAINALDAQVRGIFRTGSKAYDDRAIKLPINVAQRLLQTDDVQTIVLLLDSTELTDAVGEELTQIFNKKGYNLDVIPWYQMSGADFVVKLVNFYKRLFLVFKLIIIIIVIFSIFNTMNMSIMERIGEIGTMMALGTKKSGVVRLFLAEGLLLGITGGILGLILGYVLASIGTYVGIPMGPTPGTTINWIARIKIVPEIFLTAFVLALFTSVVSSIYPAYKASRLEIAVALRHNV